MGACLPFVSAQSLNQLQIRLATLVCWPYADRMATVCWLYADCMATVWSPYGQCKAIIIWSLTSDLTLHFWTSVMTPCGSLSAICICPKSQSTPDKARYPRVRVYADCMATVWPPYADLFCPIVWIFQLDSVQGSERISVSDTLIHKYFNRLSLCLGFLWCLFETNLNHSCFSLYMST